MRDGPARRIATELRRRGLATPARLLVDSHLPMVPLLSDAGAALRPLLGILGGGAVSDLASVLDDDGLERLMTELDLEERDAESG